MVSFAKTPNSNMENPKRFIDLPLEMKSPHVCGKCCLGPIAFHKMAKGDRVSLSQGDRRAERLGESFKDGLVFSSRPIQVQERVRLRVDCSTEHWHGALRVGFTTVQPTHWPLPPFSIPDLTSKPGYWAEPVPTAYAFLGSELQFWVTKRGRLMLKVLGAKQTCMLQGINVNKPLWAMIDVYGQTSAVLLLDTVKRSWFEVQMSCPTPPPPPVSPAGSCLCAGKNNLCPVMTKRKAKSAQLPVHFSETLQMSDSGEDCVACLCQKACIVLWCGHKCLCHTCASRVCLELKKCPLCRETIRGLTALQPSDACAPTHADKEIVQMWPR